MAGRPRARTQIVPPQDVLDNQAMHTEKLTLYSLGNAMTDSNNIFKWLTAHRLIKTTFRISMGELPPEICQVQTEFIVDK